MSGLPILFHAEGLVAAGGTAAAAAVGSPLYDTPAAHLPALAALLALPVAALAIGALAPRWRPAARLRAGYRARPPLHRLAAWLVGASAVIHVALIGHHDGLLGALMVVDALLLAVVGLLLLTGRRWRPLAGLVLAGSIGGWMVVSISGRAPDQIALLTKLIEIAALAIVLVPTSGARVRGWVGTATVLALVLLVNASAWAGAFAGGSVDHHLGVTPQPGTLLPGGDDRPPTAEETAVAEAVWRATAATLRHYEDPAVALRAGYDTSVILGPDAHVPNPAYLDDGRFLDPTRPENLIYAESPAGPVLLGAMFEMPWGGVGPSFGGPLTVWHGHEQVCLSLTGMTGLVSPFGSCPLGSVIVARTGEMLHVWTAPGAPARWGELDEAWKTAYVATVSATRIAAFLAAEAAGTAGAGTADAGATP